MSKKWLVKAGGRILGPYSEAEIVERIKTREVVALDEVAESFGRWYYVRDSKSFGAIIDTLRNNPKNVDELTQSLTDTSTETIGSADQVGFGSQEKLAQNIGPRDVNATPSSNIVLRRDDAYFEVKTEGEKTSRSLYVGLLIVVAIVGYTFYSNYFQRTKTEQQSNEVFTKTFIDAEAAKSRGDYPTAVRLFKQAREQKPGNWEVVLSMAPLLILDQENILARRMLDSLIASEGSGDSLKKRAFNLLALAAMVEYDNIKAETHLDHALEIDSLYGPAVVNRGIVHYLRKEYDKAENQFYRSRRAELADGVVTIYRFLNAKEEFNSSGDISVFGSTERDLDRLIQSQSPYLMYGLIAKAHILANRSEMEQAEKFVERALRVDPDLLQDHVLDPRIYREDVMGERSVSLMEELIREFQVKEQAITPRIQTLHGLLIHKNQDAIKGRQVIEDSLKRAPEDDLIRSVFAYVQMQSGVSDKALGNIEIVKRKSGEPLSRLIEGRLCMSAQNTVCVQDVVDTFEMKAGYDLQKRYFMAWLQAKKNNTSQAAVNVSEGLRISSNYKPLLQIQHELEVKGE